MSAEYPPEEMVVLEESAPTPEVPTPQRITLYIPHYSPLCTYIVLAINGLVFVGSLVVGQERVLMWGAKINEAIVLGQWWRLITPIFLHADPRHFVSNSYALVLFGKEVERAFGRFRFLLAYLLSGVGGTAASFLFNKNPAVGASGAIFGLVGMLALYEYCHPYAKLAFARCYFMDGQWRCRKYYRRRVVDIWQALPAILPVAIMFIFGLIIPGVNNWGHIGGALTGILLGWFFAPEYQVVQSDPRQMPQVVDISSPRRWTIGVMLAGLGILLAFIGGIICWGG